MAFRVPPLPAADPQEGEWGNSPILGYRGCGVLGYGGGWAPPLPISYPALAGFIGTKDIQFLYFPKMHETYVFSETPGKITKQQISCQVKLQVHVEQMMHSPSIIVGTCLLQLTRSSHQGSLTLMLPLQSALKKCGG